MADDTSDILNSLAQYGIGEAGAFGSNAAMQQAYATILKNLQDRFGDYKNLAPAATQNIQAQQLGPSALASIPTDEFAKTNEQAAIAQLGDIANRGGLDLADMSALNKVQGNINRNNTARNLALQNSFAARGQLGSGAQLAMSLANNQNAAELANQQGEQTAGAAQRRAMEAILQKAQASRTMSNDEYNRQKAAAEAADAIAKYNANARTGASEYNNNLAQQAYANALGKLQGETNLTNSMNNAFMGQGTQTAKNIAGSTDATRNLVNSLWPKGSSSSTPTPTSTVQNNNTTTVTNSDGSSTTGTVTDSPGTDTSTAGAGDGFDAGLLDDEAYA